MPFFRPNLSLLKRIVDRSENEKLSLDEMIARDVVDKWEAECAQGLNQTILDRKQYAELVSRIAVALTSRAVLG